MIRFFSAAGAAALCLAAASAPAQMPPPSMNAAVTQAMPYLALAGEADVYEVTSSQIALMKSRNPAIRQFATMLIDHHTRTTNQALAAAKTAGVAPPPPALDARHRAMITELMAAPPAAFDGVYLRQQVPAHQTALALHSGYAQNGGAEPLRATARAAVPIVQSHLQRAQAMRPGT